MLGKKPGPGYYLKIVCSSNHEKCIGDVLTRRRAELGRPCGGGRPTTAEDHGGPRRTMAAARLALATGRQRGEVCLRGGEPRTGFGELAAATDLGRCSGRRGGAARDLCLGGGALGRKALVRERLGARGAG
jgi:hypothetical protein